MKVVFVLVFYCGHNSESVSLFLSLVGWFVISSQRMNDDFIWLMAADLVQLGSFIFLSLPLSQVMDESTRDKDKY